MKKLLVTLLALFLLGCDKAPIQVRSSEIKDEAIAGHKLSSCGVGIFFDQKTGDTVAIMYKGKQFVPIAERDSLRKLVKSYKCEFETMQDAVEFRSKCCDSVLIVRSVDL